MKDRKRLRRENPERATPIRNFSKLYRRPDLTNGANSSKPIISQEANRASTTGPLAEGVKLAYAVIDNYIAEGRQTAEGLNTGPYTTAIVNDNVQSLLERMLRFQAEILPVWIDTLATLVTVQPAQNGHSATRGNQNHSNGTKSNPGEVAIQVVSSKAVIASVDLDPNCEGQSLAALSLNSVNSKKPALTDVSFVRDDVQGRLKLVVRIPDDQPPGTYIGIIVDRNSDVVRGTLRITIAD
jgi:hypothetical protein